MYLPDTYVVIDTETTGLDPKDDRLVEIAWLHVEQGEISEHKSMLVNAAFEIPAQATAIHGITTEMAKGGTPEVEAVNEFLAAVSDPGIWIISFNGIQFDLRFLYEVMGREFSEVRRDTPDMYKRTRDVGAMFKAYEMHRAGDPGARIRPGEDPIKYQARILDSYRKGIKWNLDRVCEVLKVRVELPYGERHRALGDAVLTHRVYEHMRRMRTV